VLGASVKGLTLSFIGFIKIIGKWRLKKFGCVSSRISASGVYLKFGRDKELFKAGAPV